MKLEDVDIFVYDCEVFAEDWLFVFQPPDGEATYFWNDPEALEEFMEKHEDAVFIGFNNKRYDAWILRAILVGCSPEEVKEVNDYIIGGNMGWQHPYLKGIWCEFSQSDLMDDTMMGTSLKSIEGHLGMSIEESSVDFEIDRKLTDAERDEVLKYCLYDVKATTEFMRIRRDYLETKMHLATLAELDPIWALSQTDPMLAAAFMGASKSNRAPSEDVREYEFPERLDYDYVPPEVREFFETIHDTSISDEELFKTKLETEIGGCPVTYAWGGVHGALSCYKEESTVGRMILNYDVASLYPSLMIEYGYVSRAVPDPQIFANVRAERFEAKRNGDKQTANALKSPLNKAYGAMLNEYNPMYDPKMARSVCISGQLSMTVLAKAYAEIPDVRIIQINTDGIMISIPDEQYGRVISTNAWWQSMTHLELEEDRIKKIWQKDVSNYALLKADGSEKVKGGYLVRGISAIGAWSINNSAIIVSEALREYLLYGTPIADTINACDDPSKFQLIAKASGKYSRVYQLVNEPDIFPDGTVEDDWTEVDRQRCNRVFAIKDDSLGRLYKVKRENGAVAKIESLPDHCLISNEGMCDISQIDKDWYIALGEKRARDFATKEKEKRKVATAKKTAATADYSTMNVYAKLALARKMFQDKGVEKSGYNDHLGSEYFTLDDLTPPQTEIFAELGLLEHFTYVPPIFEKGIDERGNVYPVMIAPPYARSIVVNTDNPEETITFCDPWTESKPLQSNQGKRVTNELMEIGKTQTYLRRYLKQQILDVVEVDAAEEEKPEKTEKKADADATEEKPKAAAKSKTAAKKPASKRPATNTERKKMAKAITNSGGQANDLIKKQLRNASKKLKDDFSGIEEIDVWRTNLGNETDNLANITQKRAEEALKEAGELREKYTNGSEDE